ncbi:hypothetical protein [Chryseobacterium sp. MP_3.2]|uniref:hypothetical protein n=1 Tax=Chryseobacterium sp. MP_3.2 TaxID=3071712 RepID=UPI002E093837|nr:hypothetical protein [Chryseobacterium sp. MP_3.2]
MHFFIDNLQLTEQSIADSFGIEDINQNLFKVTTEFQLTTKAKTFACQDGMIIIQQSTIDEGLVNIMLKPRKSLNISLSSVKYYIYRGVSKDSLFINDKIIPNSQAPENSFLKRIWQEVAGLRIDFDLPDYPDPTLGSFGYDNDLLNDLEIEKIFNNSQSNTFPIYVKEGEWIGNFEANKKIGFEVILENDNLEIPSFNNQINLEYLRKQNHVIDVSGLTGFEKRAKQELALSYIDPCAFFGLHYDVGVNISVFLANTKTIENKKQAELYNELLDKFHNRNKVYLDIRSENGYSYNFYKNYKDVNNKNIKMEGESLTYETDSWPILILDSPNKDKINLNLRIDDNLKPILFSENRELYDNYNNSCFIDDTKLLNENPTDWSKDIALKFPLTDIKNVSYYAKLYYYRQENTTHHRNASLKSQPTFNAIFCPINLDKIADNNNEFQHLIFSENLFSKGILPNIDIKFSYGAEAGVYWDASRILFYTKAVFKNERIGKFFNNTINSNNGFDLEGNFNKTSFLSSRISLNVNILQETVSSNVYEEVKVLDIIQNKNSTGAIEDLICFGITKTEFSELKNITGFTDFHHRYIYLEELENSPFTDKYGIDFRKYEIKTQGLDDDGKSLIKGSDNPIFVYSQNGLVFASKEFAKDYEDFTKEKYFALFLQFLNINPKTTWTQFASWFIEGALDYNNSFDVTFAGDLSNIMYDLKVANSNNTLNQLEINWPNWQKIKQNIKNAFADNIHSGAKVVKTFYDEIIGNPYVNNTVSIVVLNIYIDELRNEIKQSTNINKDTMNWDDLFKIWLFELSRPTFPNDKINFTWDSNVINGSNIYNPDTNAVYNFPKGNPSMLSDIKKGLLNGAFNEGNTMNRYFKYDFAELYATLSDKNIGIQMLGSYDTKATVISKSGNVAVIKFFISNILGWESATRFVQTKEGTIGVIKDKRIHDGLHLGGNLKNTYTWTEIVTY